MRLGIALVVLLGPLAGAARADRVAVLLVPGAGAPAGAALDRLPGPARASARGTRERLLALQPAGPALARLAEARELAREKMAAFAELEEAERAVAEALSAAFDALPYLEDVSIPVALAFDLATIRLTLGDRDGAGEALGLSARLDPGVTADVEHPPALQALANEIRPPADAAPTPLPPPRVRALGASLGVDTLVIGRRAATGGVELFVITVADGREQQRGRIEPDGSMDPALWNRLIALELAVPAPRQAVRPPAAPDPGRRRARPSASPWPWLAPTLVGVAAAAGVAIYLALPGPRDDARIVPAW